MADESVPAASQRRLETRTRLLDAAIEVFAEEGVHSASVEAICQRADFTRGAFYSNFSSKEELFLAVLDRELSSRVDAAELKARALAPTLKARRSEITLEETATLISGFFLQADHATVWFILETEFLLMASRDPELAPEYHEFMTTFTDRLGRMIDIVIRSAGREILVPVDLLRSVLSQQHESALRLTAIAGEDAPGGLSSLGTNMAQLIFALTSPTAPKNSNEVHQTSVPEDTSQA